MSKVVTKTTYNQDSGLYAETVYKQQFASIVQWTVSQVVYPNLTNVKKTTLRKMLSKHTDTHSALVATLTRLEKRAPFVSEATLTQQRAIIERSYGLGMYYVQCLKYFHGFQAVWQFDKANTTFNNSPTFGYEEKLKIGNPVKYVIAENNTLSWIFGILVGIRGHILTIKFPDNSRVEVPLENVFNA